MGFNTDRGSDGAAGCLLILHTQYLTRKRKQEAKGRAIVKQMIRNFKLLFQTVGAVYCNLHVKTELKIKKC